MEARELCSSQNGHVEVVRLLLARQDVKVNKITQNGTTALIIALENGHVEVLRLLLAHQGVEVNKSAADGAKALIMASQNGHVEAGAASARAPGRRGQQDLAERGHGADARVAHRPT